MADYKDKALESFNNIPYKVGEKVYVNKECFNIGTKREKFLCVILEIVDDNTFNVKIDKPVDTYGYSEEHKFATVTLQDISKYTLEIGYNPFVEKTYSWNRNLRRLDLDIDGIISILKLPIKTCKYKDTNGYSAVTVDISVPETVFNPFVINKNGEREYYQRDYVWSLKDEQDFIDSIYKNLDCGKIVVRNRSYKYVLKCVKTECDMEGIGYRDVVDGKQRLRTLIRFMNDEFAVSNGYYYSDLSEMAQRIFCNSQCLTFLEFSERATDEEIIRSFLMINYSGKPLSKEHLDYVEKIYRKL